MEVEENRGNAVRKKVILLFPLTYNNGTRVSRELLSSIYFELYGFCNGMTVAGQVQGAYRMADGTRQEDLLEQVWLAVDETKIPILRQMVSQFGAMLQQERMYFEVTDAHVEFLPSSETEGDQDEQSS